MQWDVLECVERDSFLYVCAPLHTYIYIHMYINTHTHEQHTTTQIGCCIHISKGQIGYQDQSIARRPLVTLLVIILHL